MNDSANVPMLVWGDVFCSSLENILNNNYSDKDVQRRIGFYKKNQQVVLFFYIFEVKIILNTR